MAHLLYTRYGVKPEDTEIIKIKPLPSRTSERSGGRGDRCELHLRRNGVHCTVGRFRPQAWGKEVTCQNMFCVPCTSFRVP